MTSVRAYYNGMTYVMEEDVPVQVNQKVIITFLNENATEPKKRTLSEIRSYMKGGRSVPEGMPAVDYVRSLRTD